MSKKKTIRYCSPKVKNNIIFEENILICFGVVLLIECGAINPQSIKSASTKIKNVINQTALKIYKLTK